MPQLHAQTVNHEKERKEKKSISKHIYCQFLFVYIVGPPYVHLHLLCKLQTLLLVHTKEEENASPYLYYVC